jgi:hypothetical protein
MRGVGVFVALAIAASTAASTAAAQDAAVLTAFSGQWYSFEPRMGMGQTCAIALSTQDVAGGLQAGAQNCAGPMGQLTHWGIVDGKIRLFGRGGEIAALGGHQQRMTGDMETSGGTPLVLERAEGDENARQLGQAIGTYRCLFAGYSNACASADQVKMAQTPNQIVTLVDLNMRSQPRSDAPVQKVVPRSKFVAVDVCLLTSDGPWCRAQFEGETGWIARNALRQGTWPVLTYTFVQ